MFKVLIIGFVWPEPKSSAAGRRMLQIIQVLNQEGFKVNFATASSKSENAFDLSMIGVNPIQIEINNDSFDSFIKNDNPDYVIFDRFMTEEMFGWRVSEHCPNAVRILDTEDLQFLRRGREQAIKDNEDFSDAYLFTDLAKREIASIYRCDISLIISGYEMKLLHSKFNIPENLLFYLPFMEEELIGESIEKLPRFVNRKHFITVGNFRHKPNADAVKVLKQTIWPSIRKQLPEAELHVYGAYESQQFSELHSPKNGFIIKGYVDNISKAMQNARVCLAPLRFGAGLKGKLIDAMNNGTPCIMTDIAAEGMFSREIEPNGFISKDWTEFANFSMQLYNSINTWEEKQKNGYEIINSRFNKQKFKTTFIARIKEIRATLKNHRQSNFVGGMLHHHTLQSTKYMSKWIEAKNRNSDA